MADSGTRRHDGLDAAMQKLDIRDSGPRRVEGSPRLHREGTGRSHRDSTASTTLSGVPPRLSAMLAASTESSRRCAVPPTSPPAEVPRRRDSTKSLAAPLGLPSVSSRFANVTSSHHRGDSSSSIRRRSTDDERGDSAYGSRGGGGGDAAGGSARGERVGEEETDVRASVSPSRALGRHRAALTALERAEILEYPRVYFAGIGAKKVQSKEACGSDNHGYDDDRGDYVMRKGDHLAYRFEIIDELGKGSFGQVMRCYDHKTRRTVAVKVIRNKKRFHQQALVELKVLEHLRHKDQKDEHNLVKMEEYFYFRSHLCITFELLSINLYDFLKNNNFRGLSLGLIRRFAQQILVSLKFLRRQRVIHCDLKPENILLRQSNKSSIKMIDLGSSCFEDERVYTYIQSRFYRAPEVILGATYDCGIDMWSLACILAELYTGYPLFPGENEAEQIACFMEINGVPPRALLDKSERGKKYFDSSGEPKLVANSKGKKRTPNSKDLGALLRCTDRGFIDFLSRCLRWNVADRITPDAALRHPWIVGEEPARRTPSSPDTHRRSASSSPYSDQISRRSAAGAAAPARSSRTRENSSATTGLEEVKLIGRKMEPMSVRRSEKPPESFEVSSGGHHFVPHRPARHL